MTPEEVDAILADIAELEKAIAEFKSCACVPVDEAAIYAAIKAVDDKVATLDTKFAEAITRIDAELVKVANDLNLAITAVDAKYSSVFDMISDLEATDKTIQDNLTSEVANLQGLIDAVSKSLASQVEILLAADKDLVAKDEELAAKDDDLQEQLDDLVDAYSQFRQYTEDILDELSDEMDAVNDEIDSVYDEIDDIWDEIDGILDDLGNDYEDINETIDKILDELYELSARVEVLETELRSIVNVPAMVVNGVNAVEFKSLSYVPMTDSDVLVDANTADAASVKSIVLPAYAYYRFNPSAFALSAANYSIVSEEVAFVTKAAADEAAVIKSVSEENGKVKVELSRGEAGNMFALAATLKSNGAVVYSDYVLAYDNALTAKDIVLSGKNVVETFEAAKEAEPVARLNVGETFSVADYVKVAGIEGFDLAVEYTVVKGKATVEAGVLTAVEKAAATNTIVKIEVVDNGSVVRRAYVNVRVMGDVKYYDATAKAVMTATRSAFAFDQVDDWAQALKDQPNTTELVKQALQSIKNQDFLSAIITLGGIPGFYTEYKTFEGEGTGRAKVDYTATDYLESQLEKINDLDTFDELVAYIQYVENLYAVSDLKTEVDATVGYVLDYIVPAQYQDNQIYEWAKTNLFNWQFSNLFSYVNDIIVDIPLVGPVNVSSWAREKIDAVLSSNSDLKNKITNKLVEVVGEIEDAYRENIDADNSTAKQLAENAAKATALSDAKIMAKAAAEAELKALNAANVAELNDGVWGTMVKLLNTDYCKAKFEEYGLGEVYNVFVTLAPQVEKLVVFNEGTYTYPEEFQTLTEDVVYE